MMPRKAEYDIVLYGATGFTGQLIAARLDRLARSAKGFRWAIAGRNEAKLRRLMAQLPGQSAAVLMASETDMDELARRTRVVLSAAGPYQAFGARLVEACAHTGTDYLDLCGEPHWMARMIAQYSNLAKQSGARLVFSCGFDSVPFDLAVLLVQTEYILRTGYPAASVRTVITKLKGSLSGGTMASGALTAAAAKANPEIAHALADPFLLTPNFTGAPQNGRNEVYYDETNDRWLAPFPMAAINTKTVHRTNFLLGNPWGSEFQYEEVLLSSGPEGVPGGGFDVVDSPRTPGEGPSLQEQLAGGYELLAEAGDARGPSLKVRVTAEGDPGYGSTSRIVSQCALQLAKTLSKTVLAGGFWTPASAFGLNLLPALKRAGVTFAVLG